MCMYVFGCPLFASFTGQPLMFKVSALLKRSLPCAKDTLTQWAGCHRNEAFWERSRGSSRTRTIGLLLCFQSLKETVIFMFFCRPRQKSVSPGRLGHNIIFPLDLQHCRTKDLWKTHISAIPRCKKLKEYTLNE